LNVKKKIYKAKMLLLLYAQLVKEDLEKFGKFVVKEQAKFLQ